MQSFISKIKKLDKYYLYSLIIICITFLVRLFIIGNLALSDDEAHYYQYAHYLGLSYFDHPPFIGYLIKAFTLFKTSEFYLRLGALLLSVGTSYILFLLAKNLFNVRVAFLSLIIFNVLPVFSFLGSMMAVPDVPLSFFWMLYIYCFYKIFFTESKSNIIYLSGIFLGFAALSKYNAVLLPISVMFFMLFDKKNRNFILSKKLYVSFLIACVIFLPVIFWNAINNWVSFGFQMAHGFGDTQKSFSFSLLLECLGAQAGYISPFLFFILIYSMFKSLFVWIKQRDSRYLFLFCISFPTFALFNMVASFNRILPHWPALAYLTMIIPASKFMLDFYSLGKLKSKILLYVVLISGLLFTLLIPFQVMVEVVPLQKIVDKINVSFNKNLEAYDPTDEIYGWDEVGEDLQKIVKTYEIKPIIITHKHYLASQLGFYVPNHPKIYCFSDRIDQYDLWQRDFKYIGPAIFITDNRFKDDPSIIYAPNVFKEIYRKNIYRNKRHARTFHFYYTENYNTEVLDNIWTSKIIPGKTTFKKGLIELDRMVFVFLNNKRNILFSIYFGTCTLIGHGWLIFVLGGILLYFHNKKKFLSNILLYFLVLSLSGVIVQIIKYVVDRPRPLLDMKELIESSKVVIYTIFKPAYFRSFPSGHSASGIAACYFLGRIINKKSWIFFIIGLSIAYSRIYVGVHFLSDVLVGGFIGYLISAIILYLKEKGIQNYYFDIINNKSFMHPLNLIFLILSYIYLIIVLLRRFLYKIKIFKTFRSKVKVISIGNITSGGTGKTPIVIELVKSLMKRNHNNKIAVLSRGYKRKASEDLIVNKDIIDLEMLLKLGDEPFMIKQNLHGVTQGVSKNRGKLSKKLENIANYDYFVLDDGAQHLGIHKDLNIILIDATNPFGNGYMLPRGNLRDPLFLLKYIADLVIVTKSNFVNNESLNSTVEKIKSFYKKDIIISEFIPRFFKKLGTEDLIDVDYFKDKKVSLVSGVANPSSFKKIIKEFSYKIVDEFIYNDHHWYGIGDIDNILENVSSDIIITTEKDMNKLLNFKKHLKNIEVYALFMGIDFKDNEIFDKMDF